MFTRGMNDEVESFQNKIISLAKQYEIYDGLIEALASKQRYLGFRFGSRAELKIKNEIGFYEQSRAAYTRALDIYNTLAAKINFSSSYLEYKTALENALMLLKNDFEQTKSAYVGYHYLLLLTEYYQNNSDFKNAQLTLKKLKELIENNVSIYTRFRLGTALVNIANNDLLMSNFDQALLHADEAIHYFSDSAINKGVVQEIEFYSLFYSDKLQEAGRLMEELYHSSRFSKTPFLYSKRAYLLANMKTLRGDFRQSKELLAEVKDIEKDKEGWNIGKRILTIINRIELKEFESVDLQVQSLQKHIKRTLKTKHVHNRNVLILRLLLKLINEQFDFKKVYNSRRRYFDLLESNDSEYCWKIKSPELIIFHEWFKSKMNVRPYSHFSAMEKEIKKNLNL
jgi:tetratricopeptide (TPR) repeat protein